MLKKLQKKQISLIAGAGICAFLVGAMVSAPQIGKNLGRLFGGNNEEAVISEANVAKSVVLPLVNQPPEKRAAQLAEIAKGSSSIEQYRARYLLADDLLVKDQANKALELLDGLENDYQALKPYVLLQQARAYSILGENGKASDKRQAVVKEYGEQPVAAKALYLIGVEEYQDRAIAEFPSHPLTWEIIRGRLRDNPSQPELQLVLAKYAFEQPGIVPVLNQLVSEPSLKPEDWEVIGNAYWENKEFGRAATSYGNATPTAKNIYRNGRGLQLSGEREKAQLAYQQLLSEFPQEREAGKALLRLAELTRTGSASLPYLDQVVANFPEQAGEALIRKTKILQSQSNNSGARDALKLLITKFANTEQAAEYRWKVAQQKAKTGDYEEAWEWAGAVPVNNPTSILAPRAGFWVGKWLTKLGKEAEAKQAYEYVVSKFPYSYYAWRSAVTLGLDVGDFNSLRSMNPEMRDRIRPIPPAGSDTFKELYLLGQKRDAWLQWETEFQNKAQPKVAEQFTEGLMQLARGNYVGGISIVAKLEDREEPEERAAYQELSRKNIYWQARYPFPYFDLISQWSQERNLNPFLVVSLIRQESRFQEKIKSIANATGLMQVLPSTAEWIAPQINVDYSNTDLTDPNDNIMYGTWYLDSTHKQYQDSSLFAVASYNAGPGNVSKWLKTLPTEDPDEFVEAIPFPETKNYVRQVLGNYWNYLRIYNPQTSQLVGQYSTQQLQFPLQQQQNSPATAKPTPADGQ
ncbi:soluble lytic murein transglycosylase-like protein [Rivularia sp. PCC 7116]|uniref:lytic transglycosylase domain-containing protein n=1 Tax=Rivularia sp. PCC 7116 TaxID=373994 RepID=UPI00029ED507|nr:transglycosylase SLT domain-containing protein [Rivularia sp. PCC 7116]AFY52760.1 soluble lytic murein transglycosylase-like protein [Rivularia sp. PCC 7116]